MSVARDSVHSFIFQVAAVVMGFVTNWIIARTLGPEGKGMLAFLASTQTVGIVLGGLGLHAAAVRHIGQKRFDPRTISLVQLTSGIGAGLLVAIGLLFYLPHTQAKIGFPSEVIPAFLGSVLLALVALNLNGVLLGQGRIRTSNLLNALGPFFWTLSVLVLFALRPIHPETALWCWIGTQAAGALVLILNVLRTDPPRTAEWRPAFVSILRFGLEAYLANALWVLVLRIDAILLGLWSGAAQVGIYSVSVAMAEALWYFPRAMNQASVSKVAGGGRGDALSLSLRTARVGIFLVLIFGCLLALIARPAVRLVFGIAFDDSATALLFLLPGMVGNALGGPLSLFISQQAGLPRLNALNAGLSLVLNLVLNAVWIPRFGASGAALASSITYLFMGFLAALCVRKEVGFSWRRLLVIEGGDLALIRDSLLALLPRSSGRSAP
ncbi:MAG: polysaccharide biosynthesis C-terminal domain-containing protein [Candidatus Eisenbacteria bacterium]